MKKILSLVIILPVSGTTLADIPNTFVAGEVATAAKFNENFKALSDDIDDIKSSINSSTNDGTTIINSDGSIMVTVNGVRMKVNNGATNYYLITTPTGLTLAVNANGEPTSRELIYGSNDCSGDAYYPLYALRSFINEPVDYIFTNPTFIKHKPTIIYSEDEGLGYTYEDELIKVNYNSIKNANGTCYASSSTELASKFIANDTSITGINSIPLIITGGGSKLKIQSEVGDAQPIATGEMNVYADGIKIGTTTYYPNSVTDSVRVKLDDFDQKTITLYKDGSYDGLNVTSANLYFTDENCTEDAYYLLASDPDKYWWDTTLSSVSYIENNDNYYTLSSQAFRVSKPFKSRKSSYGGSCFSSTFEVENKAYKKATLTNAPEIPIINPPITIDGYTEPTSYDSLPEAF